MGRNHKSARDAGTRFTRDIADHLAHLLEDDRIEPRGLRGAKDRGDIAGIRWHGQRVVIECKDRAQLALPQWLREAEVERGNDDAVVGVVVHKRRGIAAPGEQYVTMTVDTLATLLAGQKVGDDV